MNKKVEKYSANVIFVLEYVCKVARQRKYFNEQKSRQYVAVRNLMFAIFIKHDGQTTDKRIKKGWKIDF